MQQHQQLCSSFCLQVYANDSYAAEAPSLTSYKDKSDEFSLSVPASKPPTRCIPCFLSLFPPADNCADDVALYMADMSEAVVAMRVHECLPVNCWWNHIVLLFTAAVQWCTSHIDTSPEQLHTVLQKNNRLQQ